MDKLSSSGVPFFSLFPLYSIVQHVRKEEKSSKNFDSIPAYILIHLSFSDFFVYLLFTYLLSSRSLLFVLLMLLFRLLCHDVDIFSIHILSFERLVFPHLPFDSSRFCPTLFSFSLCLFIIRIVSSMLVSP